jgi:hypothetical protein
MLFVVSVYMAFEKISQRNLLHCLSARKLSISGFTTIKTNTALLLGGEPCVLKATDSCVTLHICIAWHRQQQSTEHCIPTPILHSWPPKKSIALSLWELKSGKEVHIVTLNKVAKNQQEMKQWLVQQVANVSAMTNLILSHSSTTAVKHFTHYQLLILFT